jgi:hypothetical protein
MNAVARIAISMAVSACAISQAQALPFSVTLESETVGTQNSTSGFFTKGVETFEGRATGEPQDFTTDFGGSTIFSGTYTGVGVNNADQYGGAFGTGQYANARTSRSYSLKLTSTEPQGVTYFGFWLSALDGNNNVTFRQNGADLFTFSAQNAADFIATLPNSSSYRCNPNAAFANQNCGEPYSYLNFYAEGNTRFDEVVFTQGPGGGYESDNHTVGRWERKSGTPIPIPAVPEPATWGMLILGFGMAGAAVRRRHTPAATAM